MSGPLTLVLSSGGIRSLVATATALSMPAAAEGQSGPSPTSPAKLGGGRVIVLHLKDGRENAPVRLEYVRQQVKHFGIGQLIELELPHLQASRPQPGLKAAAVPAAPPPQALLRPQILLIGLVHAIELGAQALIWPVQFNGDFDAVSRVTEQVLILTHLAQLEEPNLPRIEMPFLDLTDRQVIELGNELEAPWMLAWSCLMHVERPCRLCPACRRRKAAFDAAGVQDPSERSAASRA